MTDKESDIYSTGYWNGIASKKLRELTDEEIWEVISHFSFKDLSADLIKFARAIEAYLKSEI